MATLSYPRLIAELFVRRGEGDRARTLFEKALGIVSAHLPAHPPDVQAIRTSLAALPTPS